MLHRFGNRRNGVLRRLSSIVRAGDVGRLPQRHGAIGLMAQSVSGTVEFGSCSFSRSGTADESRAVARTGMRVLFPKSFADEL